LNNVSLILLLNRFFIKLNRFTNLKHYIYRKINIFVKNSILILMFLITSIISTVQNYYFGHALVEKDLSNNSVLTSLQNGKGFLLHVFFEGLSIEDFEIKLVNIIKLKNTETLSNTTGNLLTFWTSYCACFFYVIFLVLFVVFTFRYYHRYIERRNNQKIDIINSLKEKEISEAKIEFFTNLAEEIRTPLTLIKNPLDNLLKKAKQWPEIYTDLIVMEKNTSRLFQAITQLQDFKKTESKKINLTYTKVNINNLIQDSYLRYGSAIKDKKIKIQLNLGNENTFAYVDEEALKKTISILLNNAIRYCKKAVIIDLESFANDFKITIKRDGDRIPEHISNKIFEPNFENPNVIDITGSGIGLSLACALVNLHKGSLVLDTNNTLYNSFVMLLPLRQKAYYNLLQNEKKNESNDIYEDVFDEGLTLKTTILLVEDNEDLLDFIARDLQESYNVLRAKNAFEAFEILEKETIQVIITDVMMPGVSGLELCKKVKTELETSHIPVVLLTVKDDIESKREGLEVGCDAYIIKPFSMEYLKAQVHNLIENRKKIMVFYSSSPLSHLKSVAHSKIDESFIKRLDEIICESLSNTELSVEILAETMAMSRSAFYRKTKDITNLNPNDLINNARLKKATELLNMGNYKVYEIAEMVGYSSQTTFRRNFQKQFKITPTEYTQAKEKNE
jgi:DNA-binding response OmpR family regulator/signal transduction histidine kinase